MNGTELPSCDICVADLDETVYRIYRTIVIGGLIPVVGVMGIIGNGLSAAVYSRPAMESSMNIYLLALAISDIIVIITGIFLYFLLFIECAGSFLAMVYGLVSLMAQTCSVYLVIFAAIDCFVNTVCPISIRYICTVRGARRTVLAICILSAVYNIPHWFEVDVVECFEQKWNVSLVMLTQTPLRLNELYITVYYVYMYTAVLTVGPLALLIVLNSTIIIKTVSARLDSDARQGEDTFALIMVVFLFIFCNMLSLAINLSESFADLGQAFSYLVDLSNLLVIINSSANFIIYFASGESFRRTLSNFVQEKFRGILRGPRLQQNNGGADAIESNSKLINTVAPTILPRHENADGTRSAGRLDDLRDCSAAETERLIEATPLIVVSRTAAIVINSCSSHSDREVICL